MQAQQFETQGWALLRRFVDPAELTVLASLIDNVLAQDRPSCAQRPGNDLVPLRWNDAIVETMLGSRRRLAAFTDALRPRDLKWISAYVSTKAPHSPPLWWHQDWWCWDHPVSFRKGASQVALLCYLGATDEVSGALRVIPGSHHNSLPLHAILPEAHGDDANTLAAAHPAMEDYPGQLTLRAEPGDAVVIDYRLLHGTHANNHSLRRDCILMSFAPEWAALPEDIKANLAMHPALPDLSESASRPACGYAGLLPDFAGTPMSLGVNRIAPAAFAAR